MTVISVLHNQLFVMMEICGTFSGRIYTTSTNHYISWILFLFIVRCEYLVAPNIISFSHSLSSITNNIVMCLKTMSKTRCDVLTRRGWWAHLQKAIGLTSNYKSKPLKFIYFVSDACTCKIFKVLNLFSTWSSGQNNEHFTSYFCNCFMY